MATLPIPTHLTTAKPGNEYIREKSLSVVDAITVLGKYLKQAKVLVILCFYVGSHRY